MKTELKQNEKVVLIIRKHWFVLLKPILSVLVFVFMAITVSNEVFGDSLLFAAGLSIVWFGYRFLDRKTNLWAVTNFRVIDEHGVFSNNSKETPLDKINNASYNQPLLGRVFNYGHVQIQSAAESGATFHELIESPKKLKDTITQYQELYKQEQIKEQAQSLANAVDGQKNAVEVDVYEELTKLHDLKVKGIITEDDFQKRKIKILNN